MAFSSTLSCGISYKIRLIPMVYSPRMLHSGVFIQEKFCWYFLFVNFKEPIQVSYTCYLSLRPSFMEYWHFIIILQLSQKYSRTSRHYTRVFYYYQEFLGISRTCLLAISFGLQLLLYRPHYMDLCSEYRNFCYCCSIS